MCNRPRYSVLPSLPLCALTKEKKKSSDSPKRTIVQVQLPELQRLSSFKIVLINAVIWIVLLFASPALFSGETISKVAVAAWFSLCAIAVERIILWDLKCNCNDPHW
jgi:hypothetical protein